MPAEQAPSDSAVVIDRVSKHFARVQALRNVSAEIQYGKLTGLVGLMVQEKPR